ncbi:rhamnogalacturonan endolyase [Haloferula luteola]|uniref:rhamnogalacturonan endolyase n=1 Tax=Haloferula luteola TaxID=595692 RepID=A0A840VH90_9BACT|nr:polysaccharide lyase family 4 protein [Haloferula luteola]MBB5352131.1 rhamnogalacturonan endolyase [Haloferula luteola]
MTGQWQILGLVGFSLSAFAAVDDGSVTLSERGDEVILENSKVEVTIDKRQSTITSMRLGRHELVGGKPIYYSMGGGRSYRQPGGAAFRIVEESSEVAHVAFLQKWKPGTPQAVDIEVHYALTPDESGVYTYGILSHPADYPDSGVGEWRMVWGMPKKNDREWLMEKIRVDELRAWEMPSPVDLEKAKPTGIKEIIQILRGPRAGTFDCKYDFNLEYHTVGCWGHASDKNRVGAWVVLGSHEFFNDGPTKQDLSSASGIIHIHFGRNHYGGSGTQLKQGEAWRKIYGPYLLYGNEGGNADQLWDDARNKAAAERAKWPYAWVKDAELYPPADARGSVSGRLVLRDALHPNLTAAGAWVGLAQPEPGGNWQNESNHYQYWTKAGSDGSFSIPHVRPGDYTFSAFVDGVVEEFEIRGAKVQAGENQTGTLEWEVPHLGRKLAWEIGVPNRRADEFRGGDDYFHGYVWSSFSEKWKNPLVYTIGKSRPDTDWNFAQGAYLKGDECQRWPWEVRFQLDEVPKEGTARLVFAWASTDAARMEVAMNGQRIARFYPKVSGGNALLREGIHAKYGYDLIDFPVEHLKRGTNRLELVQARTNGAACHVMYDYVALELP